LTASLAGAPSALQLPYARGSEAGINSFAEALAARCDAQFFAYSPALAPLGKVRTEEKAVLCMTLPEVKGSAASRQGLVADAGWCSLLLLCLESDWLMLVANSCRGAPVG
jgi:hypothetical protein